VRGQLFRVCIAKFLLDFSDRWRVARLKIRGISEKIKQGCREIILSRLFKTNYKNKKSFYGVLKFNLMCQKYKIDIIPLGGINNKNLLNLNLVKSQAIAILSAVKKKPTISSRLF